MMTLIRIVLAGILGGALVFVGGYITHAQLELGGRIIRSVPNEAEFREDFKKRKLEPGVYFYPFFSEAYKKKSPEEKEKERKELDERYKDGPSGMLVVAPKGEAMMDEKTLGSELGSNILAAFIAAIIIAQTGASFPIRWTLVVLLGAFTWLSTSASYAIWYRFPWPFILDELASSLIEWGLGGIAIAALAWPSAKETPTPPPAS